MEVRVHERVLEAANNIASGGDGTFSPDEVVRALPDLNENTVRTHIVSRCCVGAPKHHGTVWPYFRRVARGRYRVEAKYRNSKKSRSRNAATEKSDGPPKRDTIHAVIQKGEKAFVAECLEVAVVTQGDTLDDVVSNLLEAIALHLDGEDLGSLGLSDAPRVQLIYDMALAS